MSRIGFRVFLLNCMRALVIVFALLFLTAVVASRLSGDLSSDWGKASIFYLASWGLPILGAAMLHQGLLIISIRLFNLLRHQRAAALVLTVVFPVVFALVSSSATAVAHPLYLTPIMVGSLFYAATMNLGHRLPEASGSVPER